jgi:hypothetical protein
MVELLVTVVVMVLPWAFATYIAWTHPDWKGTLLATLTLWLLGFLALVGLVTAFESSGPAGMGAGLWLIAGWIPARIYCSAVTQARKRRLPSAPADASGDS